MLSRHKNAQKKAGLECKRGAIKKTYIPYREDLSYFMKISVFICEEFVFQQCFCAPLDCIVYNIYFMS